MFQSEALDILKSGRNTFLTGQAGSGKTYVLNQFIKWLKERDVEVGVTASTGIAATHMGGMTIHSFSGIGIRDSLTDDDVRHIADKKHIQKRLNSTEVLIIDEISMLHDYHLDMIERILRAARGSFKPFGGVQIVLCGDFFQLPPVSRGGTARFVTDSPAWKSLAPNVCYLHEQFRQLDNQYLSVLNAVRENRVDEGIRSILASRHNAELDMDVMPTKLYTHNRNVDEVNVLELEKISGETRNFEMDMNGPAALAEPIKKSCLAPETLTLKPQAAVMFVKNNFEKGYVNGTLGVVTGFNEEGFPIVRCKEGQEIVAEPEKWSLEEDGRIKASITQIPLRLAWAITVHKSQGMSLDAAEIDLSRSFEPGMGYVALSRVRSLSGIRLLGLNDNALRVSEYVLALDSALKSESKKSRNELRELGADGVRETQRTFLKNVMPKITQDEWEGDLLEDPAEEYVAAKEAVKIQKGKAKKQKTPTYRITMELINDGHTLASAASERGLVQSTLVGHLEEALARGEEVKLDHLQPPELETMLGAFRELEETKLTPVRNKLGKRFSFEELRLARLFLN